MKKIREIAGSYLYSILDKSRLVLEQVGTRFLAAGIRIKNSIAKRSTAILWNILSAHLTLWPTRQPYESTMGRIFIQDFPLAVMPIRKEDAPSFRVVLNPPNAEMEEILTKALSTGGRDRDDLTDAVSDFIEDVTRRLLVWGDSAYNISSSFSWCEAEPRYKSFALHLLPGSLFNWVFFYVHCINKRFSDQVYLRRGMKPSPTFLRRRNVFVFTLPPELCTKREHKKMAKTLIRASNLLPRFVREDMSKYLGNLDYSQYHRASMVELLRTVKGFGANINFVPDEFSSGYYRFDMFIRFYGTAAVLRQSIVDQLNDLLFKMGMAYSLTIEGLPTPSDAIEARRKMHEGIFDFEKACNLVKTP